MATTYSRIGSVDVNCEGTWEIVASEEWMKIRKGNDGNNDYTTGSTAWGTARQYLSGITGNSTIYVCAEPNTGGERKGNLTATVTSNSKGVEERIALCTVIQRAPYLKVYGYTDTIDCNGGDYDCYVNSSSSFTATTDASSYVYFGDGEDYATYVSEGGDGIHLGGDDYFITVKENTDGADREFTLTVTNAEGLTETVTFSQTSCEEPSGTLTFSVEINFIDDIFSDDSHKKLQEILNEAGDGKYICFSFSVNVTSNGNVKSIPFSMLYKGANSDADDPILLCCGKKVSQYTKLSDFEVDSSSYLVEMTVPYNGGDGGISATLTMHETADVYYIENNDGATAEISSKQVTCIMSDLDINNISPSNSSFEVSIGGQDVMII